MLRIAVAALVAAAGCATTADFRLSKIAPDEAAIAGRLTVIYNGKIFTENCHVVFGDGKFKLSPGGIVLYSVKKGWTSLERLECNDGGGQHIRIRGAHFFARGDGWVTDFGDVMITWDAAGGFKATSLFGMVGGMVDEAIDDGEASVDVRPPAVEVRDAFRRQTGVEGRWTVQQMSQPKNGIRQDQPDASDPTVRTATAQQGFFCASSPERSSRSVCERQQAACERARKVLASWKLASCTPAETAWCFVTEGSLRCSATQVACDGQLDNAPRRSGLCGEQY